MTVTEVSIDLLSVRPTIQRPLDMKWARKIAANFDPEMVGVITISHDEAGVPLILDGQHRVAAAKLAGHVGNVRARVSKAKTDAEMARTFLALNNQKAVSLVEKFKVRVTAEDEVAVAVNNLLIANNWVMGSNVSGVKALENAYAKLGASKLNGILEIGWRGWGVDGHKLPALLIDVLSFMYVERPFNTLTMIQALKAIEPSTLHAKAAAGRDILGQTRVVAGANALIDAYNKGKRQGSRLERVQ